MSRTTILNRIFLAGGGKHTGSPPRTIIVFTVAALQKARSLCRTPQPAVVSWASKATVNGSCCLYIVEFHFEACLYGSTGILHDSTSPPITGDGGWNDKAE